MIFLEISFLRASAASVHVACQSPFFLTLVLLASLCAYAPGSLIVEMQGYLPGWH